MFDIVIEGIARADAFDDQSCTGVQYYSKARFLVRIVTDDFRDRGGMFNITFPMAGLWVTSACTLCKNAVKIRKR
jgi:hypothetical protein